MEINERIDRIINRSLDLNGEFPLPSIIELSPADSCNKTCWFCPRGTGKMKDTPLVMEEDVVRKIAKDLFAMEFNGLVIFSGYGEPLMNRNLEKFVEIMASNQRIKVDLVTNGTLLTEKRLSKLLLSGINKILVSVYEESELDRLYKLFEPVNPQKYEFRIRYNNFKLTNRGGSVGKKPTKKLGTPCNYLAYCMMIDWNGDVNLCPQDFNRNVKFGNVMSSSLWHIWTSPYMGTWRRRLFESRQSLNPCGDCDTNGCLHGENHKKAWVDCEA